MQPARALPPSTGASSLGAAAASYAALGWAPLRLRAGAKVPAERHGLRDATLDPAEIERRFAGWRGNIGAAVPAGHLVVDVDGEHALGELRSRGISLPATATQRTPRGRHFVYSLPAGMEARQTVGEIAPGVDTRAGGRGYIVAAPSVVNGVRYAWEVPLDFVAEAPGALLNLLAAPAAGPPRAPLAGGQPLQFNREPVDPMALLINGAPEGQRNAQIFRAACALRRIGASAEVLTDYAEAVAARCSPALPPEEARRIARSAARYLPAAGAD